MTHPPTDCPCGSNRSYPACCERWHVVEPANTAEQLMRSRYSAYVMKLEPYLLATWHPSTCPRSVEFEPGMKWLGLVVESSGETGPDEAQVTFTARYKVGGASAVRMHERSRFVRQGGRWYYVDETP